MSLMRTALVAMTIAAFFSRGAEAQSGDLVVQLTGGEADRLSGALVALVDSSGLVVAEGLTGARGGITLRAPHGRYRLRVRRVGFRPWFMESVSVPHDGTLAVPVQSTRVVLNTMVVSARAECGTVATDALMLAEVWEEIVKALQASQFTSRDRSTLGTMAVYEREIDARGVVIKADTSHSTIARGRPFGAIDPASLVKDGYVRGNEAKGWEYFGPDEAVLLSRGFAETHCFRLVRDERRPGEIGMAFEPASSRKLPDIVGTLWLDETTSELKEMSFIYVNADIVSRFRPSGFTRFRRMPSGAWIVSEWRVRMPRLSRRAGSWQNDLVGHIEKGGSIVAPRTIPVPDAGL
jgi:hypothetical protein